MNKLTVTTIVVAVLLLFRGLAWVRADQKRNGGDRPETIELKYGGLNRTSLVYVPRQYDGKTAVPLVLSFHGRHGQGKNQADLTEFHKIGDRVGFIVAYPDGVGKSWNAMHGTGEAQARGVDDVGFVDALLAKLTDTYKIDPDRIYAVGVSNGAFFTHRLGCERSNRFAAIATVAGELSPALARVCKPEQPLPILIIHGTKDKIVPYDGGETEGGGSALGAEKTAQIWSQMNGCNGQTQEVFRKGDVVSRTYQGCRAPVTLCTVQGGGHTWPGGLQYLPKLLVGPTNRDVSASEMIWQFFDANPKRRR